MIKKSHGTESEIRENYERRVVDSPLAFLVRTYKGNFKSESVNDLSRPDNTGTRTPHIPNKSIDDY